MSETINERHFRDRIESMRQLASSPESERTPQDREDLVSLCVELSHSGQDLIEKEFRRIFKDKDLTVDWLQERRRVLEDLSETYVQLAASIRSSYSQAQSSASNGLGEDAMRRLEGGIKAIADARQLVLEKWPVGGPTEIANAKAAIARGESFDADEAFAEIAGIDVATWRASVEEYKQHGNASSGV